MTATNIFFNFVGFRYSPALRKEMVILENPVIDSLDSSIMMKMAADSKAKRKKPGSTRDLLG